MSSSEEEEPEELQEFYSEEEPDLGSPVRYGAKNWRRGRRRCPRCGRAFTARCTVTRVRRLKHGVKYYYYERFTHRAKDAASSRTYCYVAF